MRTRAGNGSTGTRLLLAVSADGIVTPADGKALCDAFSLERLGGMFEDLNKVSFINKLQAGDELALDYLMTTLEFPLSQFLVRHFGLRHEDAEDIINESWLKIYRNVRGFKPQDARLTTWIYSVVKNTAIDRLRKQTREGQRTPLSANDRYIGGAIKAGSVPHYQLNLNFEDETVEGRPLVRQLRQALASLSEPARNVLVMRQNMTTKEIAQIENISEAGVRMRYNRAFKDLRVALKKVMADEG